MIDDEEIIQLMRQQGFGRLLEVLEDDTVWSKGTTGAPRPLFSRIARRMHISQQDTIKLMKEAREYAQSIMS